MPAPNSNEYFQLVSGLGDSLELGDWTSANFGDPLAARQLGAGTIRTIWNSNAQMICLYSYTQQCTADGNPILLEPYQHSRPMQVTADYAGNLDSYQQTMIEWNQGG
ncbi:hypothetical protein ACIP5Y_01880 [Nocardia sp. NPDC088792]|uniref:hypothetical protein n=1 Tax=Nocardia sp. NPDC088792 TaxID=3364332 RepID=UPI0037F74B4F